MPPLIHPQDQLLVVEIHLQKNRQRATNAAAAARVASAAFVFVSVDDLVPVPWRPGDAKTWVPKTGWYPTKESQTPSSPLDGRVVFVGMTKKPRMEMVT